MKPTTRTLHSMFIKGLSLGLLPHEAARAALVALEIELPSDEHTSTILRLRTLVPDITISEARTFTTMLSPRLSNYGPLVLRKLSDYHQSLQRSAAREAAREALEEETY